MDKRFFTFDDGATYYVVASGWPDALRLLADSGIDFPCDSRCFTARELTTDEAATKTVLGEDCDGRPARGPLTGAELGDWFCSEW